jgi:bifunctional non-homologous end joining protein LigD
VPRLAERCTSESPQSLAVEGGLSGARRVAEARALKQLARDEPQNFTANLAKAHRKGKVYVDYLRNVRGANAVGVYSTRAREGAPVSTPVEWGELDRLSGNTDFTVAEVPLRVIGFASGAADPWARYLGVKQRAPTSRTRELAG